MTQTRTQSAVEAVVNTVVSFATGVATNYFALPFFGFPASATQAINLTLIFTAISLVRQYLLRRVFNKLHNKPRYIADSEDSCEVCGCDMTTWSPRHTADCTEIPW